MKLTLLKFVVTSLWATFLAATCVKTAAIARADDAVYLTHSEFRAALNKPISASWQQVPLRSVLNRISQDRQVAIILDRRIDPTRELQLSLPAVRVSDAIERVAQTASAKVSVVGDCAFVGTASACYRLRTLIHLRANELYDERMKLTRGRHFDLAERSFIQWNDLERPSDLLNMIAAKYQLSLKGTQQIPHDLWAKGVLPNVNAAEALSLVLIQFDLSFQWEIGGESIEIVPAPRKAVVELTYEPRGKQLEKTIEEWRTKFPSLAIENRGNELAVAGTIEEHEALDAYLNPRSTGATASPSIDVVPLSRRQFTLHVEKIPAIAIMKKLSESGIEFAYDADQLKLAGIRLEAEVSFDANKATADEFFTKLFEPLGLEFRIENATVELNPKSPGIRMQ